MRSDLYEFSRVWFVLENCISLAPVWIADKRYTVSLFLDLFVSKLLIAHRYDSLLLDSPTAKRVLFWSSRSSAGWSWYLVSFYVPFQLFGPILFMDIPCIQIVLERSRFTWQKSDWSLYTLSDFLEISSILNNCRSRYQILVCFRILDSVEVIEVRFNKVKFVWGQIHFGAK